jgi:Asp-tRNA(Asn)/Glu-tRNA(Gln) amidotransferase A subunit family amidase
MTVAEALRRAHADTFGAIWATVKRPPPAGDGPLAGIPFVVKDNFDLAGLPTTGGLAGPHPPATSDAQAVISLRRAGAVPIAKTAMDPLAWTTGGQAPGFGPCLNPVGAGLSPGGSSSGSAVAVAAGIAPLGLGSDTAGSVRIPASYCGVVGLKLAPDATSLEGCLPLAPSFDSAGVLARTVAECRVAYQALTTPAAAAAGTGTATTASTATTAPRVALLSDLFEAAEPAVRDPLMRVVSRLEAAGTVIERLSLDYWAPGLGLALAVEFAHAWSARRQAEPDRLPPEIVGSIDRALTVAPARYRQHLADLRQARIALTARLGGYDGLLCPTVPTAVPTVVTETVQTSTRFTRIFNALGWPAISVPVATDAEGRPVGMQIANAGDVPALLAIADLL